ncbi:transcriptional regulator, TetR family [Rhizobium sp. PDO1-076]|uniref:TetR/AcrR family transcriptional regulator n=1 Tax=Rhizobium sp. PDO1-076 TaxID=1125979 RepID=UPI00024E3032|nr:TetR/AcrR family transcriptional regulator [Rhizobium sp. PDO1-076]EHS53540.1 transcriptional regulator, TetR family [Rhizobium sp. PDO1-076]
METKVARQRLDPAKRAELILDAALGLFGTSHFSIVTMRDIAVACDVNVALLYHYFKSKDHLIQSVLAQAIGQIIADFEMRRARPGDDFLGEIGIWFETHALMAPTMMTRMVKLMADYAAQTKKDPQLDAVVQSFYCFERELIINTLQAGIDSGRYAAVDTVKLARIVGLHLDGIFHGAQSRGENRIAADIGDLRDLLEQQLKR